MAEQRRSKKAVRVPVAPDGGYGWIVLIACFLISFVVDGCMYSFGVVLGDIKDNYQVSQEKANLLTSLMTGFLFCSGPVVSSLTKQFGIRPVVMVGAVITALMHVFSAFSPSIYLMMLFYGVIGGISTGCTYISSLIIVADYFDKKQGLATGVTMAGSGVGAFAFAPFSQWITSMYDWKFALIIWASIIIQCCVMGALLRPVPTRLANSKEIDDRKADPGASVKAMIGSTLSVSRAHDHHDDDDDEDTSCIRSCGSIAWNIIKEICNVGLLGQNFAFLLITLSNFFIFAGYFIPFLYIPIRAKELEIDNFALVLSIIGIVNIPARLVFGALADKLSPVHLNSMCAVLATVSLWIYPPLNTFILQCVFAVIFATGISGTNCLTTPYLKEIVGMEKFSNAMGIINLFRGVGCFIGPFIGGFISDKTQSSVAAFVYSAIMFTIGTVCTILVSVGGRYKWFKNYHKYQVARQNDPDI